MITTFTDNFSSAKGAVAYVLGSHDSNGKKREVAPVVLRGDVQTTLDNDKYCDGFKNKSVSGSIAFRDDEKPTRRQLEKICKKYESTICDTMKDRSSFLWVLHEDKGNVELHFVFNCVDLESGKYFNPFYPPKRADNINKLFSAIVNEQMGYEQVHKKPFAMNFNDGERKALSNKEIESFRQLKDKRQIDKALQDLVKNGVIKNRNELVQFLKDSGKVISRENDSFISIENKNIVDGSAHAEKYGKNIRLKGGIYEFNNGKDYADILKESKERKRESFNMPSKLAELKKEMQKGNDFNVKRFNADPLEAKKELSFKSIKSHVIKDGEKTSTSRVKVERHEHSQPTQKASQSVSNQAESHQSQSQADDNSSPGNDSTDATSSGGNRWELWKRSIERGQHLQTREVRKPLLEPCSDLRTHRRASIEF
jgi:hypothetical protein